MVHAKTFIPSPIPVMEVFGNKEFVITPLPETIDQVPTPLVAVFAAITAFGLDKHKV